jgi:hypothetical protein
MNRNNITPSLNQFNHAVVSPETAIHEAGHATAIYLGNKQRHLPPIFFQIFINPEVHYPPTYGELHGIENTWIAKIDGGRLIHTLPTSIEEATRDFSMAEKRAYQQAFEADIVNLLVGPLAEAKFVALRDGKSVNQNLVTMQSLHYYGGTSDIQVIREYLECFIANKKERIDKITELFIMAFNFINTPSNWRAIVCLADYILCAGKNRIDCEEAGRIIALQA